MCDEERQSSGRTEMHELPSKADTHNDKVNKFNASTRQRGDRSRTIFSGTFTACSRGLMHPPLPLTHSEERNKLHGQSFNLLHCPLSFSRDLKLGHCHGDNSSQKVCSPQISSTTSGGRITPTCFTIGPKMLSCGNTLPACTASYARETKASRIRFTLP